VIGDNAISARWANKIADGSHHIFKSEGFQPLDREAPRIEGLSDMYRDGQSLVEVIAKLGVSQMQYFRACDKSSKFKRAHDEGLIRAEAWWSKLGRAGAAGKIKLNSAAWVFSMKNRFAWTDKKELTATVATVAIAKVITPDMTPEDAARLYNEEILKKS